VRKAGSRNGEELPESKLFFLALACSEGLGQASSCESKDLNNSGCGYCAWLATRHSNRPLIHALNLLLGPPGIKAHFKIPTAKTEIKKSLA